MSNKKTIVGIYRRNKKAKENEPASELMKKIEVEGGLKELMRIGSWKQTLTRRVQVEVGENAEVLSVSAVHDDGGQGIHVAVTIEYRPPKFGQRKKPVKLGNRALGNGPVKTGKTMAAKRRSSNR